MNKENLNFYISATVTLIFLLYFILFFGVYYVDYEGIAANIVSGVWFDNTKAASFWCSDHGFLLIAAFATLNQFVCLPLWGILHLVALFIGFTLINIIVLNRLNKFSCIIKSILILLNNFFLFSFILLNVTCHSTSFIILFPSLYFLISKKQITLSPYILYLFIVIGILLRIQIFPFALLLVFFFLWVQNSLSLLHLKRMAVPLLLYCIIYAIFSVNWQLTENYGIRFLNTYELNIFDRGNIEPVDYKADETEKLRYQALTKYVFLDSEQMSDEYFNKVVKYKTSIEYVSHLGEFKDVILQNILNSFNTLRAAYKFIPSLVWLLTVLMILSVIANKYNHIVKNSLLIFCFFLTITVLSLFILVTPRFSATFLILCFLIMIYSIGEMLQNDFTELMHGNIRILVNVFTLLIPVVFVLNTVSEKSEEFKKAEAIALDTYSEINQLSEKGIVFIIDYPWSMNNRNVLKTPSGIKNDSIIILQADFLTYLPLTYSKINLYTNRDATLWKTKSELINNKSQSTYIATIKGHSNFLIDYFKTFYGYELYDIKFHQSDDEIVEDIEIFSYSSRKSH